MSIKFGACSAFAATLFGFALTTMPAHAYVEAGMLNCRSLGTAGYIVVSARTFDCIFIPSSGAPPQYYQGNVQRFGAQIGFTNDVALGWAVLAATSRVGPGALAGGYIGASAGAAARSRSRKACILVAGSRAGPSNLLSRERSETSSLNARGR